MNSSEVVGTIDALWRFPVKSMQGERVDAADVGDAGIIGDRVYALVDRKTGKVASAKHPKLWPHLLACQATFPESPHLDDEIPPARIDLADGTSVMSDAPDVDAVLSRFFGRDVELARAAPADFTIDQYHPDVENLDPEGHRDELTGMNRLASNGLIADPCGVPRSRATRVPSG
jgi:MOSC domain-containing protein